MISRNKAGWTAVTVYTLLNIKVLYPIISNNDYVVRAALLGNGFSYFALTMGLFLNASLVLYWLKNSSD